MSKIILCTKKEASHPFIFLNTKVEINTYEELCFYIYNNTVLISKSSLSDKLFDWIRDELDMPELAALVDGPIVLAGLCDKDCGLTGNFDDPEEFMIKQIEHTYSTFPWKQNCWRTRNQSENILFKPL